MYGNGVNIISEEKYGIFSLSWIC